MKLTENYQTLEKTLSKIVAKAWMDDEFHKRFISDPAGILREAGLMLEDFVKVIVTQGSTAFPVLKLAEGGTAICEISLPSKPADLTDEQISAWGKGTFDMPACIMPACT